MKHFTRRYKRLRMNNIKLAILAVIINIFFLPSYVAFENTGNNMFTIFLNGQAMGVTGDKTLAEEALRESRRRLAVGQEELVLVESELSLEGAKVLWGKVDDPDQIISNMEENLRSHVRETMYRAYTVKVNDFMINLSSKDEVLQLLQAAINKYDDEGKYKVELSLDADRELSVLTTNVLKTEELEEKKAEEALSTAAGIDAVVFQIFETVEPAVEKDFDDYDLGLISIQYGDTVEVVEAYLSEDELTTVTAAIEEVTKEQEKNEIYEVVAGDTLSGISIKTNIPMEKLIEMNDSLTSESSMIRIGDELIITVPEPELTIEHQEERYYEEDYEEPVIYIDNNDWYTNETKTLQEPSAGHRKVIVQVSYRNDVEVAREIIKEEVTFQAVPKIMERGTKIPPTYIKPLAGGRFTSGFGGRKTPTKGASSNHKGVDWATPVGTTVVASASGTVIKAGWGSGYGYVVYINHTDGRQTRYGHLSKVLVSAGQTVTQGQKIALSGNTGVSTGPHVHFEILVGGVQVNPLKYLN